MAEAVAEAKRGFTEGEVPIGAVAVRDGIVIARGHNRRISRSDITAHAEMECLRDLSSRELNFDLTAITIYSTLEPCAMCLGAMIHYGIEKVIFGEYDLIAGACGSKYRFHENAKISIISGVYRPECRRLLLNFFKERLGKSSLIWEDIEIPSN